MTSQHCSVDFDEAKKLSKKANETVSKAFSKLIQDGPPSSEIMNALAKVVESLNTADVNLTKMITVLAHRA